MSGQLTDQDAAAIRTVFDTSARLLEAGDFPAWSELWAEDAVMMPPNNPSAKGRAAILAFGEAYPEIRAISFTDVRIEGTGDLAVGTSAFSMTIVPQGAGEIQDTGKQLVVFRKQSDGKWLASTCMFNSDLEVSG